MNGMNEARRNVQNFINERRWSRGVEMPYVLGYPLARSLR